MEANQKAAVVRKAAEPDGDELALDRKSVV